MPIVRIRSLAGCGAPSAAIENFRRLGARFNALRTVSGSLRFVSPGVNSYASFCSLLGRPIFPQIEDAIVLRWSPFGPGRTVRNYIGHIKKACALADCTLSWYTPSVREITMGLRFAKKAPFKYHNFIYAQDLYRIINFLGRIDIFAQLAFLACLFSLRIPSDAIPMRRARPSDRIPDFPPQADRVLIGARECQGAACLIIKMSHRRIFRGLHS